MKSMNNEEKKEFLHKAYEDLAYAWAKATIAKWGFEAMLKIDDVSESAIVGSKMTPMGPKQMTIRESIDEAEADIERMELCLNAFQENYAKL